MTSAFLSPYTLRSPQEHFTSSSPTASATSHEGGCRGLVGIRPRSTAHELHHPCREPRMCGRGYSELPPSTDHPGWHRSFLPEAMSRPLRDYPSCSVTTLANTWRAARLALGAGTRAVCCEVGHSTSTRRSSVLTLTRIIRRACRSLTSVFARPELTAHHRSRFAIDLCGTR